MDGQIQLIELSMIDRPFKISRESIDPERVRELAESIREKGLLQPILLRPNNGRYEIIAGDRRFLAHKLLGVNDIRAIIFDTDDRETVVIRAIENIQRENLSYSEEGRVYALLLEMGGLTQNQIAKKTGKSVSTIQNHLRLLEWPDYIQTAVDRRMISFKVAHVLMEIEDIDFRKYYSNMAIENGINEKVARVWVDDHFKSKDGSFYGGTEGRPDADVTSDCKPVFVTCEVCHGPTEIKNVRSMMVCRECTKKVRHT